MPITVSSQVSQVPHGVGMPAQLVSVPLRLIQSEMRWPVFASISSVIVPPGALRSYAVFGSPITVPGGMSLPSPSSWLRTMRQVPSPMSKQAMPSWIGGVMKPSVMADPKAPNVWYLNPGGSASSGPAWTRPTPRAAAVDVRRAMVAAPAATLVSIRAALPIAAPITPARTKARRPTSPRRPTPSARTSRS